MNKNYLPKPSRVSEILIILTSKNTSLQAYRIRYVVNLFHLQTLELTIRNYIIRTVNILNQDTFNKEGLLNCGIMNYHYYERI